MSSWYRNDRTAQMYLRQALDQINCSKRAMLLQSSVVNVSHTLHTLMLLNQMQQLAVHPGVADLRLMGRTAADQCT